ncbi:MAG: nuclear transport factor 2 family protein [Acetobacteraceae bacterium]|nr:nuclear transport factor 2 family protein [Acetobacteraceae bacterium]
MKRAFTASLMLALCLLAKAVAASEENADDFMQIHGIEITFHQAGTTKNLDLMLSVFTDDATLSAGGKTYVGKEQIRGYWQAAGPFQTQNQWVAYTPAFRIKYDVQGDKAHLYFECLYVDKAKNAMQHTRTPMTL